MNETVRAPRCSLKWKNSTSRITLDMLVDSSDDSLKNAKQNRCHPQRPHLKSRAVQILNSVHRIPEDIPPSWRSIAATRCGSGAPGRQSCSIALAVVFSLFGGCEL